MLFCDIDGFKRVNDTAGHAAGDAVLTATAARLRDALRAEDTVARVGGDEFVAILEPAFRRGVHAGTVIDVSADALAIAARLREVVRAPVLVNGVEHVVTASIGITFARAGSEPDEILRDADTAMYRAKHRGRDRHEIFDGTQRADLVERGRVENVLRRALDDDRHEASTAPRARLTVAYQPIFDLTTMQIVGAEALARLTDDRGATITPDVFIPIAEETGLIAPLGRRVLDIACDDLARWRAVQPHRTHLGVAVNLSARQAGLADLHHQVTTALHRNDLDPALLTLELTESVLIDAGRSTMTAITDLHTLGVQIAIDDFGTGYASLRYLTELPVTSVKIDRSFTAGLPHTRAGTTIVHAIAALAHNLDLRCVAEGIETETQLHALPPGLHGQGFLLGRPASSDAFAATLTGH